MFINYLLNEKGLVLNNQAYPKIIDYVPSDEKDKWKSLL